MPFYRLGKESRLSPAALNAAAASLLYVALSMCIVLRHWHAVNMYGAFVIFAPLGIQIFGQFQRARGIVNAMGSANLKSRDAVFDVLFWAAIGNLTLLAFIEALLRHIDGFF